MNYKESNKILEQIKKSKSILISCHRGPDMDSIGSALALAGVLKDMGKNVKVVCTSNIPGDFKFLKGANEIVDKVEFARFDYSYYDLFFALDASSWQMIAYNPKAEQPKIKFIVIDHHKTNEKFGDINLVEPKVTSVGELLFYVFEDWKVKIDKDVADGLLTGILGDTGVFMFPGVGNSTFEIAQKLITNGADKDKILLETYRTRDINLIKFLGIIIDKIEIDVDHKFAWSAIPFEIYDKHGKPESGKEVAASMFMASIKGTDFGVIMVEIKKNLVSVSFRARTNFDVSRIATKIGGGGHVAASGARIEDMEFSKAVEKVLAVSRKYAKKN